MNSSKPMGERVYSRIVFSLATYAFMTDNHLCLFFAHPPQLCLSEMLCDLPCAEDVWDAKDAPEFERLYLLQASSSSPSSPPPSPMSVVNALLTADDPTSVSPPSQHWRPFDLYVAISGKPANRNHFPSLLFCPTPSTHPHPRTTANPPNPPPFLSPPIPHPHHPLLPARRRRHFFRLHRHPRRNRPMGEALAGVSLERGK